MEEGEGEMEEGEMEAWNRRRRHRRRRVKKEPKLPRQNANLIESLLFLGVAPTDVEIIPGSGSGKHFS